MEEIKVGEYVRYTEGEIYKADKIFLDNANVEVKEHSFNIIDLIEEGDYVNGKKILEIKQNVENGLRYLMYDYVPMKYYVERTDKIKSIVTKEQFKAMEYVIKEV